MASSETWPSVFTNRGLATAFDSRAAQYAKLRPGYPPAAVDAAIPAGVRRVLDLAAGTGKLTASLLDRDCVVLAVEPLLGMLAQLSRLFPSALAVAGRAEHIPLADSSVDAVVVGQAFHWFEPDRALDEIVRVLRPAGTLALLWNHDDESDPMVADLETALDHIGRPGGGNPGMKPAADGGAGESASPCTDNQIAPPPFTGHPKLTDPVLTTVAWRRTQSVDELIGLMHTYSYVIRASESARRRLDDEVRSAVAKHVPGQPTVEIPMNCQVWRSSCR